MPIAIDTRPTDGVDLSIRQFSAAWRLMCGACAGHTIHADDGTDYIFSGAPIAFFNAALLTGRGLSGEALQAHGHRACAWASDKNVPWLFVVTCEALDPDADPEALLDDCGLAPMMRLTGMLASNVAPVTRIPEGLQLLVPQDDTGCSAVLDVNAGAYGMDLEAGKQFIGKRSFWDGHVPVLGLVDGKPAASAAVMMVDGHRYVAMVATDPAQQRRGFAEATMRSALEEAGKVHGERPTVLHATDAGRPVYERMGYTTISTHMVFMEKKFLHA
jgi:ribosomal protein S18 acetylase RimI-like enzyme